MHHCPRCGKETNGSETEGGITIALCYDCHNNDLVEINNDRTRYKNAFGNMRRTPGAWEYCPNCDAPLKERVFVGDSWECEECGEDGTREPGNYDTKPLIDYWR